ncbi:histidinol-phosphatase HisJ [Salibacterium sp. K-3]
MPVKRDGHIHTPYCPHGSTDSFHDYIEHALDGGLHTITFTEHAPLPEGFTDPVPDQDSSMRRDELEHYIADIEQLKKEYSRDITIYTGLEIDYIKGFEMQSKSLLNDIGPYLDDSILSVHFLSAGGSYVCLDYSPESFADLIQKTGSAENVAALYFDTLHQSITSDLGPWKPERIGHMTLVKKFQKKFPNVQTSPYISAVLDAVSRQNMSLDYNGAGLFKTWCREPYPDNSTAHEALKRGIPLIYGSDAHQAADVLQGIRNMTAL